MRFSILSYVLFGLVVVGSGFKFEARDNFLALTKFLAPHRESQPNVHRRQVTPQCLEAYEEFQSERFQQCYEVVLKVQELDLTTSDLETYCGNDCTSYVIEVANKIARYCQAGVSYLVMYSSKCSLVSHSQTAFSLCYWVGRKHPNPTQWQREKVVWLCETKCSLSHAPRPQGSGVWLAECWSHAMSTWHHKLHNRDIPSP